MRICETCNSWIPDAVNPFEGICTAPQNSGRPDRECRDTCAFWTAKQKEMRDGKAEKDDTGAGKEAGGRDDYSSLKTGFGSFHGTGHAVAGYTTAGEPFYGPGPTKEPAAGGRAAGCGECENRWQGGTARAAGDAGRSDRHKDAG